MTQIISANGDETPQQPQTAEGSWLALTPQGVLHAFSSPEPDEQQQALQALLRADQALGVEQWLGAGQEREALLATARQRHWVQLVNRPIQAPDTRLADFIQHVIAPLSGQSRAVLASDTGFSLGYVGVDEEKAELLSAAAADYAEYAVRQSQRGLLAVGHYVSFFSDPLLLIPDWSLVPFWVDGNGYWLALGQEPLLNNQALVELVWGVSIAGHRFAAPQ